MPPKSPHPTMVLTEFDQRTIGRSTQMMKALISFLEPEQQRMFGLMIRVIEFNMTLDYFNKNRLPCCALKPCGQGDILSELKCYCSPEEQKQLDMISGILKAQQLQAAMAANADNCGCKDDSGNSEDGCQPHKKPASSPLDMLTGFLTPEQMKLCRQYEQML